MKKKLFVLTLAFTLIMTSSTLAFANVTNSSEVSPKANIEGERPYCKGNLGIKGSEFREKVLKEKLRVSQQEIDKAKAEGKSLKDLIKEKGITYEQYKTAALEVKFQLIDKAVSEGRISSEKAKVMKERIKTRLESRSDFPEGKGKSRKNIKEN